MTTVIRCACGGESVPSRLRSPRTSTFQSAIATSGRRMRTERTETDEVASFVASFEFWWRIAFWISSRPTIVRSSEPT